MCVPDAGAAEDYQDQRGEASVQVLKVGSKYERTLSTYGLT